MKIKVWFDAEADFLEVRFSDDAGYEKETNHDAVMEGFLSLLPTASSSMKKQIVANPFLHPRRSPCIPGEKAFPAGDTR